MTLTNQGAYGQVNIWSQTSSKCYNW